MSDNKVLSNLQKLGKSLMTPVAVMPAAALLLRLGDWWSVQWMVAAGAAIMDNLPIIFAVGIAVGFAEENNGTSAIAALVGYLVMTKVQLTFNETINMGVLGGIIVGVLTGYLYNKYKAIKLPDFLGFFGGRRFVPIITSFYTLLLGILTGFIWPPIQNVINALGNGIVASGAIGAFLFGFFNRLLIPFGLHHVINTFVWFQFGEFTDVAGKVVNGDLSRFFAGDPTAGMFMTGFFPIMMFALPAACLAMIHTAKDKNKKAVTGMLLGIAFTSFLTGVTEPIEFSFMFLAPVLYLIHAVLTGAALAITNALGMRCGFGFSAGAIDYGLSYSISSKPIGLLIVGLIFGVIYYFLFVFFIKKFDLPTPGRLEEEESASLTGLSSSELVVKAYQILDAIGGKVNVDSIDACITRIRLTAKDGSKVDEAKLKSIGASGVMKMGSNNYQIVVGTIADPLVTHMKSFMK
jgi:PTS system N-acetylglucosamine-specific IIC component